MHFYLLFVVMLFSSTSYAYQCVSVEGAPFSQLHTMTDVVKGSSAMFSANKKRCGFIHIPIHPVNKKRYS